MAPEETSTTSRPAARATASVSTSSWIRPGSMPPVGVVSDDEPILTTIRCAPAIAGRPAPRCAVARSVPGQHPRTVVPRLRG